MKSDRIVTDTGAMHRYTNVPREGNHTILCDSNNKRYKYTAGAWMTDDDDDDEEGREVAQRVGGPPKYNQRPLLNDRKPAIAQPRSQFGCQRVPHRVWCASTFER
jgi:hypothetical protein